MFGNDLYNLIDNNEKRQIVDKAHVVAGKIVENYLYNFLEIRKKDGVMLNPHTYTLIRPIEDCDKPGLMRKRVTKRADEAYKDFETGRAAGV